MARLKEKENLEAAAAEAGQKLNIINQAVTEEQQKLTEKKNDEKEKMLANFYISKAKKKEYEKLFGANGVNLSSGIRMCLDYVAMQLNSGKLIMSESGIHENVLNNLK